MKRSSRILPPLNGRLLDIRGNHVWTHMERGKGEATFRGSNVNVEETDEAVILHVEQGGFWFSRTDLELELPPGTRASFRLDAGGIHAEDIPDLDLDFQTQAGTMHIENVTGHLRLRTKSGTVHVERFSGAFDIETYAGTINLEIEDLVAGSHRARTYAGSLHVSLAGQIEAEIDARATLGSVRNQAASHRDAVVKLSLISDVGGVRVEQHGKKKRTASARAECMSLTEILERVAKGVLGVEQADALIDRLERKKKEKS